jgi:hypothetical protein
VAYSGSRLPQFTVRRTGAGYVNAVRARGCGANNPTASILIYGLRPDDLDSALQARGDEPI